MQTGLGASRASRNATPWDGGLRLAYRWLPGHWDEDAAHQGSEDLPGTSGRLSLGFHAVNPDNQSIQSDVLEFSWVDYCGGILKKAQPYHVHMIRAFCSFCAAQPEKVPPCHGGSAPLKPGREAHFYPYHHSIPIVHKCCSPVGVR